MHAVEILILVVAGAVMYLALRGVRRIKEDRRSDRGRLREAAVERLMQEAAGPEPTDTDTESRVQGDSFRFSPELFEHRARVMEVLDAQGFAWLSHYSSVDCLHDVYGIEVCGIHDYDDAKSILDILLRIYPDWKPG